jgi:AraC-like DNA-binding protein
MTINASLLATLIDFASYRGIPSKVLYALVEEKNIDWSAPESSVSKASYLRVLAYISQQDKAPQLGLNFGFFLNLSALGMVHQISLQTKSIEQALLVLQSYLEQQFPLLALKINPVKESIHIELHSTIQDQKLKAVIVESSFVFIARELQLMLPHNSLVLFMPNIPLASKLSSLNNRIQEGTFYSFQIDSTAIKQGINPRNLQHIEVLLPQYLKMIYQNKHSHSFVGITKNIMLHLCAPELPNMQAVCDLLALSTRSFQRKLHKENSSFRKISLEIKQELSTFLEADKQLKIQDIAYILGYSEASAYIHARNNWQKA